MHYAAEPTLRALTLQQGACNAGAVSRGARSALDEEKKAERAALNAFGSS